MAKIGAVVTVIVILLLCFLLGLLLQLTDAKDKLRAVAKHLEVPEMQVCVCVCVYVCVRVRVRACFTTYAYLLCTSSNSILDYAYFSSLLAALGRRETGE